MDIFSHLKADHDRQRDLLAAVAKAPTADGERQRLFQELCAELDAHAAAEEQTFHAALLSLAGNHELVQRGVTEHDDIAAAVAHLADANCEDPDWACRFDKFGEKLAFHLEREERDDFALARIYLGESAAVKLGKRFAALKRNELAGGIALASQLLAVLEDLAGCNGVPLTGLRL